MSEVEEIQLRHGSAAQWVSDNPVLAPGECGVETDTHQAKVGDGSSAWNSIPYIGAPTVVSANGLAGTVDSSGGTAAITLRTTLASGAIPKSNGTGLIPAVPGVDYTLGLEPVAVQSGAYTAAAGQLIPCDATSAGFTVTLPSAPPDATSIVVKKIDSTSNVVTINASGADVFNKAGGSVSLTLILPFEAVRLQYYATPKIWYVVSTDAPRGSLDARYLQTVSSTSLTDSTATGRALITATNAAAAATAIGATPTPTASVPAEWDANKNLSANIHFRGFATTPTAGTTTVLTVASAEIQNFTGTLNQTVTLPTTNLPQGAQFTINNLSTGTITVQSSGANVIYILAAGTSAVLTAVVATPTTAANWHCRYIGTNVATGKLLTVNASLTLAGVDGKTLTVNNNLTLAGTDGTTLTGPGSSDTLVGLNATQTLANKTLTSPALTNATGSLNAPTITSPVFAGTGVPNAAIQQAGINNFNTALQSQVTVAGTAYYITNSGLVLPAAPLNGMVANKTTFTWEVAMAKTAAGTGAFNIIIYRGTNGSTADTADVTQSIGTQTAAVDSMLLLVQLTITVTGGTGSYFWSIIPRHDAATATGFGTATGPTGQFSGTVASVALNTASLIFGLGFASITGTPTITVPYVRAFAFNMD